MKPYRTNRARDWYRYQRSRWIAKRLKRARNVSRRRLGEVNEQIAPRASKNQWLWLGCGHPHCWLCHYQKWLDIPLPRDIRKDAQLKPKAAGYVNWS